MHDNEVALQLVLKAIESGKIKFDDYLPADQTEVEKNNAFSAKQISDYYLSVLHAISDDAYKHDPQGPIVM